MDSGPTRNLPLVYAIPKPSSVDSRKKEVLISTNSSTSRLGDQFVYPRGYICKSYVDKTKANRGYVSFTRKAAHS